MSDGHEILITIGALLLIGLLTDALGRRTSMPRVTLLLLFGFMIGPGVLDVLPDTVVSSFDLLTKMALVMFAPVWPVVSSAAGSGAKSAEPINRSVAGSDWP